MKQPRTNTKRRNFKSYLLTLFIISTSCLFTAMKCERDVECPAFDETWDLYNYTVNPRKLTELDFTNVVTGEFVSLSTEESSSSSELFTCSQICPCKPRNYQSAYNDRFDIRSNSFQMIDFGTHGSNFESKFMDLTFSYDRYVEISIADFGIYLNQKDKTKSNFSFSPEDHLINDTVSITESVLLRANYEIEVDSILIQYQQGLVAFWVGDTLWMRDDI